MGHFSVYLFDCSLFETTLPALLRNQGTLRPIVLNWGKIFIVFLIPTLLAVAQTSRAGHIAGANLSYECIGPEEYRVTLSIYRDCSESVLQPTQLIKFESDCGQLFSVFANQYETSEVSQLCPTALANSSCNGGPWPGMEIYKYEAIVTLAPCDSWEIFWDLCTRSVSNNVDDTTLPCYRINALLNNLDAPCNNSPVVGEENIPYVCVNQPVSFNLGITEMDGDSLRFYLVPGQTWGGAPIAYEPGYSGFLPIPGISIGNNSGQVSFTPTQTGQFTVVIEVEEYNSDEELIGTIRQDFLFIVENCPQPVPQPSGDGFTNFTGTGNLVAPNEIQVCPGDSFCTEIEFASSDPTISIDISSTAEEVLEGATLTTTGTNPVLVELCWTVPPGFASTNQINIVAQDDACPVFGVSYWGFVITPTLGVYGGEDQIVCEGESVQLEATGDSQYLWQSFSGDPIEEGVNFSCTDCPNPIATPSQTTVYTVTGLTTTSGCLNTDTVVVGISLQDVSADFTSETCFLDDATIALNIPYGSGNYSFLWETGDTTQNLFNLPAGDYEVFIEDLDLGCSTTEIISIDFPPFPDTYAGEDAFVCSPTYQLQADSIASSGYWLYPDAADVAFIPNASTHNAEIIVGNNGTWNFVWVENDGNNCINSDTVTLAFSAPPMLEAGEDDGVCGPEYTFSAELSPIDSAFWTGPPGAVFDPDPYDPNATVTVLDYGTHSFFWTLDLGNDCGTVTEVQIEFSEPLVADAGIAVDSVCGTEYNLQGVDAGLTSGWTTDAPGIDFLPDAATSAATINSSDFGTYNFIWNISNANCSDIDTLQLAIIEPPVADAGTDEVVCGPEFQLAASPSAGEGLWIGPPGALFAPDSSTPDATVTAPSYGNFDLIWVEDNGYTCIDSDTVAVNFVEVPVADAGPDDEICGLTYELQASPSVGSGTWTADAGVVVDDPTASVTAVTVPMQGDYTFTWTEDNGNGCEDSDQVVITFHTIPEPDAGNNSEQCGLSYTLQGTTNEGSLSWSAAPGVTFSPDELTADAEVTAPAYGIYEIVLTADNNGCIVEDTIEITFIEPPVADAGVNSATCGLNYQLQALPSTGTGTWTFPAGYSLSPDESDPNTTIIAPDYGPAVFTWTEVNGVCADSAEVEITFVETPTANPGSDQVVCGLTAQLEALPSVGNGIWYTNSSAVFTPSPNDPIAEVETSDPGIIEFWWVENNGSGCTDSASVQVEFTELPTANAGANDSICGLTTSLGAELSVGTGTWSATAGLVFDDLSDPNSNVTATGYGSYTLTWTEINGAGCEGTDTVTLVFSETPSPQAGPDQSVCGLEAGLNATLSSGSGVWSGTGVSFDDPGNPQSPVTADDFGSVTLTFTEVNGNCSSSSSLDVTFVEAPVADAGIDQEICGLNATLNAVPSAVSGEWSGPAELLFVNPSDPDSDVSASDFGVYQLTWTESAAAGCTTSDQIELSFFEAPIAVAGEDTTVCGLNFALEADPVAGEGTWSSTNPDVEFLPNANAPDATVEVPSDGTYILTWSAINGICADSDEIELQFTDAPLADAGAEDSICGLTYSLNANGSDGNWSSDNPNVVFTPDDTDPNATVTVPTHGDYIFEWFIDNGNDCSDSDSVTVSFYGTPQAEDLTINCVDGNLNYVVSFTIQGGDPDSYSVAGDPGELTGNTFVSDPIENGTTYSFQLTDANGCGVVNVSGSNVCPNLTYAGTMSLTPISVCGGDSATAIHNNNHTLDGNDALIFVLHLPIVPSIPLGTIWAQNSEPVFSYQSGMEYGLTYYISAVVGNSDGMGGVDFDDPLLSVSSGTPVVFYETPEVSLGAGGQACAGDTIWVDVAFSGLGSYQFTYAINGSVQPPIVTMDTAIQIPMTSTGQLQPLEFSNGYCVGETPEPVNVQFLPVPEAEISGGGEVCEGGSEEVFIEMSGQSPFEVVYAINGVAQPLIVTPLENYSFEAEEAGVYTLESVEDQSCAGETLGEAELEITPEPIADAGPDLSICFGQDTALLGSASQPGYSYQWSGGQNLNDANAAQPELVYNSPVNVPIDLTFELTVSQNGCSSSDQVEVTLLPVPEVTTNSQVQMCANGAAQLQVSGATETQWLPDEYIDDANAAETWVYPPENTEYTVSVFNEYGCSNQDSVLVIVNPMPEVEFALAENVLCAPAAAQFQNLTSSEFIGSCLWNFGNGLTYSSCNPSINVPYPNPGSYNVSLTITSPEGCSYTELAYDFLQVVGPQAGFSYSPNPADISDSRVQMQNQTIGGSTYMWDFGELGSSFETNPLVDFPDAVPGEYEVCLTAIDEQGCLDEYCSVIEIEADVLVYIPNAFSPNGDGINDLFHPVMEGVDIVEYEFMIFNRRGKMVWQTTDPDAKWDGSDLTNDYYDDNQVYTWKLRIKDRYSTLREDRNGTVMVIR